MNKKMRILAALAAAVIAISATAMLSGCGGNKDGDKTATTVPATTAQATTKAAESSAANGDNGSGSAAQNNDAQDSQANNQSSNGDSQDNNNGNNEVVEKHGNITREEAGQIALSNVPYGQTITICTPGTYEGKDCWAVGVADTTGKVYEVYVSSIFCEYNLATQAENPDLQSDAHADDSSSAN